MKCFELGESFSDLLQGFRGMQLLQGIGIFRLLGQGLGLACVGLPRSAHVWQGGFGQVWIDSPNQSLMRTRYTRRRWKAPRFRV